MLCNVYGSVYLDVDGDLAIWDGLVERFSRETRCRINSNYRNQRNIRIFIYLCVRKLIPLYLIIEF